MTNLTFVPRRYIKPQTQEKPIATPAPPPALPSASMISKVPAHGVVTLDGKQMYKTMQTDLVLQLVTQLIVENPTVYFNSNGTVNEDNIIAITKAVSTAIHLVLHTYMSQK